MSVSTTAHCGICSELYTDPRMLPCLHSFCCKCLQKSMENKESQAATIKCPTCEKDTPLPESGITGLEKDLRKEYEAKSAEYEMKLKSHNVERCDRCVESSDDNTATVFCCECCEFLCSACMSDHKRWKKTHNHELLSIGEEEKKQNRQMLIPHQPLSCQTHSDEILKFYCETCSALMCRDCIVINHTGHDYNRVENVAEKESASLQSSLLSVSCAKSKLSDALALGDKMMQQVQAKQKSVEEDIKRSFNEIRQTLRNREEALLARAAEIGVGKLAALRMQGEELKAMLDELDKTSEMVSTATQAYTPTELLSVKGVMSKKLLQLLEQVEQIKLEPCKSDAMPTDLDTSKLLEAIGDYGNVFHGCSPSSSKAIIVIPTAILNKERSFIIEACDDHDKQFPFGGERVTARLKQVGSNDPPPVANVVDNKDGTYSASLTPQVCGAHELSVTIETEPIRGSPFSLYVRPEMEYMKLSSTLKFKLDYEPSGIAVDHNGDIYVAMNDSIKVFNQQGTVIRTIGTYYKNHWLPITGGTGDGQFKSPSGIAVQGDVVYVADQGNHRVQKLTTSGKFLSKFGSCGSEEGQLNGPCGLCVDDSGRIFVSEVKNNRVSVFEPDGTFAFQMSHSNLRNPKGIAFDVTANLHVADWYSSGKIHIFSSKGEYISQYDSHLSHPSCIVINEEGCKFIGSGYNYDKFEYAILGPAPENKLGVQREQSDLCSCSGITLDSHGVVYLCSKTTSPAKLPYSIQCFN